ncbi:MAG: hypothetical protein M1812_005431 [Candelaria pacifica]|nr:MAG: hypothetical protein M1812_005431 [Candelaria pacifica]
MAAERNFLSTSCRGGLPIILPIRTKYPTQLASSNLQDLVLFSFDFPPLIKGAAPTDGVRQDGFNAPYVKQRPQFEIPRLNEKWSSVQCTTLTYALSLQLEALALRKRFEGDSRVGKVQLSMSGMGSNPAGKQRTGQD